MFAFITWRVAATGHVVGDHLVLRLARALQRHHLVHGMRGTSSLAVLIVVVAMIGAALVALTHHGAARRRALMLLVAVGGSLLAKEITKELISRPSPVPNAGADEYPSGHATTTFALAAELLIVYWGSRNRRWLILAAVLFIGGVGASRVLLEYHYASDVYAGWALALAVVGLLELFTPGRAASDRASAAGTSSRLPEAPSQQAPAPGE